MSVRTELLKKAVIINVSEDDKSVVKSIAELSNARLVGNSASILPIHFSSKKNGSIFFKSFEFIFNVVHGIL